MLYKFLKLTLPSLMVIGLGGCSYAGMTYESTLSEDAAEVARIESRGKSRADVEAYIPADFNAELASVAEKGYELIGYSKFTSLLIPRAAGFNARHAGQARGADIVVMAPPAPARLNQHSYLFTFWRDVDSADMFFGGYYGDADPSLLAIGGCAMNRIEVQAVARGSPADRMGLRQGDVVYGTEHAPIGWARELDDYLLSRSGSPIKLRVVRKGEDLELSGVLGQAPDSAAQVREPQYDAGLRMVEATFNREQRNALDRRRGVFVDGLHFAAPACAADLIAGDLLFEIDGRTIETTKDALRALKKARKQSRVAKVRYLRRGEVYETGIDLTDVRSELLGEAQRRQINEAVLAYQPWVLDEGADFSWIMMTAIVAGSAATAYEASLRAQQERAASYSSHQSSESSSSGSRRGSIANQSGSGMVVSTTSSGYTVRQVSRRGQTALFDPNGNRVPTRQPMPQVSFDGKFPSVDFSSNLDAIQFGHANYEHVQTVNNVNQALFPF